MLELYRSLIALRHERPELVDPALAGFEVRAAQDDSWIVLHRGDLRLVCNLGGTLATVPLEGRAGAVLLSWGDATPSGSEVRVAAESFVLLEIHPATLSGPVPGPTGPVRTDYAAGELLLHLRDDERY
jgi:maltooligosyltrehalose trehalohydrolase